MSRLGRLGTQWRKKLRQRLSRSISRVHQHRSNYCTHYHYY